MVIKLKILFENTTKYSKDIYENFLTFHQKKYRFSYITYNIIVTAFVITGLILQVKYHNYSIAILLCCGLTFFLLWRLFHPISEVSKEYKSEKIKQQKEYTFKFYTNFFTVEDNKQIYKLKYFDLYKIFETSTFFYLYLDKNHAFLIDKSKFKENNTNEFSIFIKKKCWYCYSKKRFKRVILKSF